MKNAKELTKAAEQLQKLQLVFETIATQMQAAETLTEVDELEWEQKLDEAYERTQESIQKLMEKAYDKMFLGLCAIYEDAENNLILGGEE